jgi:hypothetical protein
MYTEDNYPSRVGSLSQTPGLLLDILNAVSGQSVGAEVPFELQQEITLTGGAYNANAVVGFTGTNSFTTHTSNGHVVMIRSIRLYSDDIVNATQYRINWYRTLPVAQVDKAAYSVSYANVKTRFRKRSTMPVMSLVSGHGYAEDISNWINIPTADNDNKIYFDLQSLVAGNINVGAKLTISIEGVIKVVSV